MPVQDQALVNDLAGGLGQIPFAHCRLGGVRQAAVAQVQRVIAKLAHHGQLRLGLGQREADALILHDRRAERLAFPDIGPGFIHRRLRRAQAFQPDQRARKIEARHDRGKGTVLLGHHVLGRNEHIVEKHRSAPDRLGADVVKMGALDAVLVQIDEKRADPARAPVRIARAREHHRCVGLGRKAHRGFFAVQTPAVAGLRRLEDQVRRVRSAARFGQAQANDSIPRDNLGHPFRSDLAGGVPGHHPPHERAQKLHIACVEIGIGDLFDDEARRDRAFAKPAEFLGQVGRDQPQCAHLPDQRAIEAVAACALLVAGRQFFRGESLRGVAERLLILCRLKLHRNASPRPEICPSQKSNEC